MNMLIIIWKRGCELWPIQPKTSKGVVPGFLVYQTVREWIMEASTVEYMLHLRQNASLLRKEAREWGFTEKQINQCIEEALRDSDNLHELANSPKNLMRTCWHYFRVTVNVMLLTVAVATTLLIGLTILTTYHEPTEEYVSNVLQPYGYQIFRTLRLVTLPVHKMFNVTREYIDH